MIQEKDIPTYTVKLTSLLTEFTSFGKCCHNSFNSCILPWGICNIVNIELADIHNPRIPENTEGAKCFLKGKFDCSIGSLLSYAQCILTNKFCCGSHFLSLWCGLVCWWRYHRAVEPLSVQ